MFADQIVETVPEGLQRAAEQSPTLITTISGPSATADIEMTRIKGVHGPRTLDVIIAFRSRQRVEQPVYEGPLTGSCINSSLG